jgi:hypothetical protein
LGLDQNVLSPFSKTPATSVVIVVLVIRVAYACEEMFSKLKLRILIVKVKNTCGRLLE